MNKPKKQHYVPQFLLGKFAVKRGPTPRVWVIDKEKVDSFLSSTKDIAHENKFYELQCENGNAIQFEDVLQRIDGMSANVINTILDTKSLKLSVDNKLTLSYFVAFQIARTTSMQKEFEAMREYIVKNMGPQVRFGNDIKTVGEYSSKDDKRAALCCITHVPEFMEALSTRAWFLCESPQNSNFILSDNPVVRDNMFDQRPYGNLGILSPGIEIYMPLSPRYCLYILCPQLAETLLVAGTQFINSHITGLPLIMTSDNVKRANFLQVVFAERFIFAKSKSDLDIAFEMIANDPKLKKGLRAKIG